MAARLHKLTAGESQLHDCIKVNEGGACGEGYGKHTANECTQQTTGAGGVHTRS